MRGRKRAADAMPAPLEAQEQATLFEWMAYNTGRYPELNLCYHVPNGGSRNTVEAHNLKLQGVKAGVPDIVLPVPRGKYAALYIELKRKKGSKTSDEQRGWIDALNRAGNRAVICYGWEAAAAEIMAYLKGVARK